MAKGTISDPRMNTVERDYGILIVNEIIDGESPDLISKEFVYIKNDTSRNFTYGSPVEFQIDERDVENGHSSGVRKIQIATDVKINDNQIGKHPIINNLNVYATVLLKLSPEQLRDLKTKTNEEIENCLQNAIDELIGSSQAMPS